MLHDGLSAFLACSRANREKDRAQVAQTRPSPPASAHSENLVSLRELREQAAMGPAELEAALDALQRRGLVRLVRRGGLMDVRLTTSGLGLLAAAQSSS